MALPTIEFVVEDGTGLYNANSFITLDFAIQYWANHGYGSFDLDEALNAEAAKQKAAIIRASRWVSDYFSWAGYLKNYGNTGRAGDSDRRQALDWPRYYAYYEDGDFKVTDWSYWPYAVVSADSIPREIEEGTAEAAWYEYENPHGLQPTFIAAEREMSVSVGGGVGIRYKVDDVGPHNSRPVLHKVLDLVQNLLAERGRPATRFGMAQRG